MSTCNKCRPSIHQITGRPYLGFILTTYHQSRPPLHYQISPFPSQTICLDFSTRATKESQAKYQQSALSGCERSISFRISSVALSARSSHHLHLGRFFCAIHHQHSQHSEYTLLLHLNNLIANLSHTDRINLRNTSKSPQRQRLHVPTSVTTF